MTRRSLFRGVGIACFGIYFRLAPHLVHASESPEHKLPEEPTPRVQCDDSIRSDGYGYMKFKGRRMTTAEAILLTANGQLK